MKGITLLLTSCILLESSYAGTLGKFYEAMHNPHFSIELGGFWAKAGKNQTIYVNDIIGDQFVIKNHSKSNGLVGLSLMFDGLENNSFTSSYGINAFYLAGINVSGSAIQEKLFTNLGLDYKLTNWPIYLDLKTEFHKKVFDKFRLTADIGIGPNIIQTQNFKEYALDNGITIPDNMYINTVTTRLSVTAGVGLKLDNAIGSLPVECGYRFFYLGEGSMISINNQVQTDLKTGNSYANSIVCSITL